MVHAYIYMLFSILNFKNSDFMSWFSAQFHQVLKELPQLQEKKNNNEGVVEIEMVMGSDVEMVVGA